MARYIDADALIERLKFKRDTDNIDRNKYAGLECAIAQCKKAPTADVVPKSEVVLASSDAVKMLIECHGYALTHDADIKKEVAREIFEEIEKTIRGALVLVGFSYKHNPKEIQCKKECYEDFLGYIAELKKKYTEEKE